MGKIRFWKIVLVAVMCIPTLLITSAWAEDKVMTIYFAGTGNTVNGSHYIYDDNGDSINLTIPKFDPELVSLLHARDTSTEVLQSTDNTHYKFFVDGVGTHGYFLNVAEPSLLGRGWNECITEAMNALESVLDANTDPSDHFILNLVGFSRGGILTMIMASRVADHNHEKFNNVDEINILAFDPVPGILLGDPLGVLNFLWNQNSLTGSDFNLPSRVKNFVGFYARDERSFRFEPVLPTWGDATEGFVRWVPGSHETMVGNTEIDGHAGAPFLIPDFIDSDLAYTSNVTRNVSEYLLSGSSWGGVQFVEPLYNSTRQEAGFKQDLQSMNSLDSGLTYKQMRLVSFTAFTFGVVDQTHKFFTRSHSLLIGNGGVTGPAVASLSSRLIYRYNHRHPFCLWPHYWSPLLNFDQVFPLEEYIYPLVESDWDRLSVFRGANVEDTIAPVPDVDPLQPIIDECPFVLSSVPTATDNVSGTLFGTTNDSLTFTQQGANQLNWEYEDTAGNTAAQQQDVIVIDTITPEITCPENIMEEPVGPAGRVVVFSPTATDKCLPEPTASCTSHSGGTFGVGTSTSVDCTATDAVGLQSACSFSIKILSEKEIVEKLLAMVADLEGSGVNQEICAGLHSRLLSILDKYKKGGPIAGCCNKIESFLKKVHTEVRWGRLTQEQSKSLIDTSSNLIATSCSL